MKEYYATITMGATVEASSKQEAYEKLMERHSEGFGFEAQFEGCEDEGYEP